VALPPRLVTWLVLLAAAAVVFPACAPERHGNSDDDGSGDDDAADDDGSGDDDASDDDASGDDDASDDDASDDDASDDDASGDDDTFPPAEDTHGGISLAWFAGDYGFEYEAMTAGAVFYDLVDYDPEAGAPDELDPYEGLDDCALWRFTDPGTGGGTTVYRSAGTVRIETIDWVVELDPQHSGSVISYSSDLSGAGLDPPWGDPVLFEAEGDDVPGFSLDPPGSFPEPIEVTQPDLSYEAPLVRDDVRFRWSGSSGQPLTLGVGASNGAGTVSWSLWCRVEDDGDFTVPGELMAELPAGGSASVYVQRGAFEYVEISPDYWIYLVASASVYGYLILD